MIERDPARDVEAREYILQKCPDADVRYYGTDGEAIYRIVAGFSGWCATSRFAWSTRLHGHVLDEVTGHGGSAAWTPRISRVDALSRLQGWGFSPDELDDLPEADM